jgi:hypothetical protein
VKYTNLSFSSDVGIGTTMAEGKKEEKKKKWSVSTYR